MPRLHVAPDPFQHVLAFHKLGVLTSLDVHRLSDRLILADVHVLLFVRVHEVPSRDVRVEDVFDFCDVVQFGRAVDWGISTFLFFSRID